MTTNVNRLLIVRMSQIAIPAGGGFADGIEFFTNPEKRRRIMADAGNWVTAAILAVRNAAEPNPWREASNEQIAGEILRRLEERKAVAP